MATLRDRLAAITQALGDTKALLRVSQIRARRRHHEAVVYRNKRDRQREAADSARKQASTFSTFGPAQDQAKAERLFREAARHDKLALRYDAVRLKRGNKAQFLTGAVKRKLARIHELEAKADAVRERIVKAGAVRFDIDGNRAIGGTPTERFRAVNLKAAERCRLGQRPNFYSQPGSYTAEQVFTGEHSGQRSDCSQFSTSVCRAAGLEDPNGGGFDDGFTGTMRSTCTQISEAEMRHRGVGFVIYGGGSGHHIEDYIDPDGGTMTIGHGSAPIDPGVIPLFGNSDYTCHAIPEERTA